MKKDESDSEEKENKTLSKTNLEIKEWQLTPTQILKDWCDRQKRPKAEYETAIRDPYDPANADIDERE